ncbi:coiled-coil domain-containing protein 124 [Galendromus occidentalis]|uniref:Coiled-coil domain-containing protein 124 n=1 Tax=Galendromus occidentalis TaxID=34638 RepID=A0AAJ7L4N8_9ACAR|nr:coiled-coil domain-containing protein 124 [Galendromus occidentalis]
MPKKLSTNQKSVDARARKDAAKQAEKDRVLKAKEDELWRDDDKQIAKKQARKEEKERKDAEERERKREREKLLQEEMAQLKGKEASKPPPKVTRAQIEKTLLAGGSATPKQDNVVEQTLVLENLNRIEGDAHTARTLDEAITLMGNLNTAETLIDRHPERRLKATFEAFEEARLSSLKSEYPNMRLSQLRQMIRKEWQRSPENPLNQRVLAYNAKANRQAQDE